LASLMLMVLQAVAAPVPGFVVIFANGLAFGLFWGWLLSLAGQILAAALCFWLARTLGRGPVSALIGRIGLESTDRWFNRWGAHAVLVTRLVPGMAFDTISYAAGLTQIGFVRFLGATAIGAAPSALLYAYLGKEAPRFGWALLGASIAITAAIATSLFAGRRASASLAPQPWGEMMLHSRAAREHERDVPSSVSPQTWGAGGATKAALGAIARQMEESAWIRFSVLALAGMLAFLVTGQLVEPGFTDYWGYLLIQISATLIAILWLSHHFAADGGFSSLTYLVVIGAITVDTLGNTADLYGRFESYDKFVHAGGTAAATAAAYDILAALKHQGRIDWSPRRRALTAFSVAMLLATGWEIYEFTADRLFETYRYAGPADAFYDIISDAIGAAIICLLFWRRELPDEQRTPTPALASTADRPASSHMTMAKK
ncbi:MAG: TVP38/TMEM64 family protein, partial [Thermomicrobiales bacterium]